MKRIHVSIIATIVVSILFVPIVTMGETVENAVAVLIPTNGNNVSGVIRFIKAKDGVRVVADVNGLTPGKHGFHIHTLGDCSGADGKTAGDHFNPFAKDHGGPASEIRHVGDLGNLIADDGGHAHCDRVDPLLSLSGTSSIIGRSVILHEKVDDLSSQPTGAAGGRVACGAIGIGK